jgi:hypothetical protein
MLLQSTTELQFIANVRIVTNDHDEDASTAVLKRCGKCHFARYLAGWWRLLCARFSRSKPETGLEWNTSPLFSWLPKKDRVAKKCLPQFGHCPSIARASVSWATGHTATNMNVSCTKRPVLQVWRGWNPAPGVYLFTDTPLVIPSDHTRTLLRMLCRYLSESKPSDNADAGSTTMDKRTITDLMMHHKEISQDAGKMKHYLEVGQCESSSDRTCKTSWAVCTGENRSTQVCSTVCECFQTAARTWRPPPIRNALSPCYQRISNRRKSCRNGNLCWNIAFGSRVPADGQRHIWRQSGCFTVGFF